MDTHALSEPALATALEVFAANGVEIDDPGRAGLHADAGHLPRHPDLQPRPEHAAWPTASSSRPSHNPPDDGGFKYNPPNGGPADTSTTKVIQDRANDILRDGLTDVKRMPLARAEGSAPRTTTTTSRPTSATCATSSTWRPSPAPDLKIGVDPLGGAGLPSGQPIAEMYGLNLEVVNPVSTPPSAS